MTTLKTKKGRPPSKDAKARAPTTVTPEHENGVDQPAADPPMTVDEVRRERRRLHVPDEGFLQRAWIRRELKRHGWTQVQIAEITNTSESTVSVVYMGDPRPGPKAARARDLTARVLGIREQVLFPEAVEATERLEQERDVRRARRRAKARKRKALARERARLAAAALDGEGG